MIKQFQFQDMLLVAHLQTKGVILNLEERFINRRSPLQSALFNRISPTKYDTTFILSMPDETNQLHGVVQTRTRHRKPEQDVIFISPVLAPGDGSHVIWQRLLTNACVKAKEAGIHRVYTRVDGTSDEFQIFKTIGFFPYAKENFFQLTDVVHEHKDLQNQDLELRPVLRRQRELDRFKLQQLYAIITPPQVRVAEGLPEKQWQIHNNLLPFLRQNRGYVWEYDEKILAVFHVLVGSRGYWFKMLVHPNFVEYSKDLILALLKMLNVLQLDNVYCTLRTYQFELEPALVACGFKQIASQIVMVKHIPVRAKDFLPQFIVSVGKQVEVKSALPIKKRFNSSSAVMRLDGAVRLDDIVQSNDVDS